MGGSKMRNVYRSNRPDDFSLCYKLCACIHANLWISKTENGVTEGET